MSVTFNVDGPTWRGDQREIETMDKHQCLIGSRDRRRAQRCGILAILLLLTGTPPAAAFAQGGEKNDGVGDNVVDAISQPLADFNLRSKDIPLILQLAEAAPYDLAGVDNCTTLTSAIASLEEVLGPDADAPADQQGLLNRSIKIGGNLLGGFVPFRGLVRQLSGANARHDKWQLAIYSGVARRSYLKGYAKGLGCSSPEESAVQSAEDVLGLKE